MTPEVTIRRATVHDLEAVAAIERSCFEPGDAFSRRQLHYLVTRSQGGCRVACRGNEVVGYLSLLARRTAQNLRIYSVAVAPEARGLGVGQQLVDAAVDAARELGLRTLTLEVRTDNRPAIALYERNGFRCDKLLRGYYHDGTDAHRMSLKVQ